MGASKVRGWGGAAALAAVVVASTALPARAAIEGLFQFNENGGTAANDTSGFNRHGTLTNFASTAAGAGDSTASGWMASGRLKFDGADDYVQTTVPLTLLNTPVGFTAEAIITYTGTAGENWTPFLGSSAASSTGQIFFIGKDNTDNDFHVNVSAGLTGGAFTIPSSTVNVFDGNTHHVAVVYDPTGAQDVIRTYVDGVLRGTPANVSGTFAGNSNLRIGGTGHQTNERWIGTIDAVRISSDVLAPGQFIPEPGSIAMAGVACAGLLARRRRQ